MKNQLITCLLFICMQNMCDFSFICSWPLEFFHHYDIFSSPVCAQRISLCPASVNFSLKHLLKHGPKLIFNLTLHVMLPVIPSLNYIILKHLKNFTPMLTLMLSNFKHLNKSHPELLVQNQNDFIFGKCSPQCPMPKLLNSHQS